MKKLLLSVLWLGAVSASAFAAIGDTFTQGDYTFQVIADNQVAVSGASKTLTDAQIPSSVTDGETSYSVTAIGEGAFYWSNITKVTLPSTIKVIEKQGFYSCSSLVEVNLNEGLESIGDYGLGYVKATSIKIPSTVKTLGNSSFFCAAITSIDLPEGLKEIGPSCFYKCPITSVVLPEGLEVLGDKAFLRCDKLTSVTLPASLKTIGEGTFYGNKFTSISLPAGLETIGDEAFYDVPLTEITLPASVKTIGAGAFSGTGIAEFKVDAANKELSVVDGVLYTASKNILLAFPPKSALTELTLPAATVGIGGAAFDRTGIQKVTVGNKFRAIDGFAFCQSKLSEINMPESLVFLGEQAFAGTNLTKVVLPSGLPMIQEAVFAECKSLAEVTIPSSVTYIALRAFFNCTSLVKINCMGATPASLEEWYEAYESPFYQVPSTAVVNVPSTALDAYKSDARWKSAFNASQFVGSLAGIAVPTTFNPADNDEVASFDGVTLTFAADMSIVATHPAITVIKGTLTAGVPLGDKISVDDWFCTKGSSAQEIKIWPADYDGYTAPFNMELGNDYYLTIPAGVVKDAAGNLNEKIVLHYKGSWVKPVLVPTAITPASDTPQTQLLQFQFDFSEKASLVDSKLSSIKVIKGSLVDGVPTGTKEYVEEWWVTGAKQNVTTIKFFASDMDGYTCPITVKADADYYVVIPAGLFRASSDYSKVNEEIILHYSRTAGVEVVEANAAEAAKEIYTLDGRRVQEMETGHIYIVRQGDKVSKVLAR